MRNNVLFTLLHDVWGESASESLRLVMMLLDEEMLCAAISTSSRKQCRNSWK